RLTRIRSRGGILTFSGVRLLASSFSICLRNLTLCASVVMVGSLLPYFRDARRRTLLAILLVDLAKAAKNSLPAWVRNGQSLPPCPEDGVRYPPNPLWQSAGLP